MKTLLGEIHKSLAQPDLGSVRINQVTLGNSLCLIVVAS